MPQFQGVVVPAEPPKPPQVTLVGSAVRPSNTADPSGQIYELTSEQIAALPEGLRAELANRRGDTWVRGFSYLPETHSVAEVRAAAYATTGSQGFIYQNWAKRAYNVGELVKMDVLYGSQSYEPAKQTNPSKFALYECLKKVTKAEAEAHPPTGATNTYWRLISEEIAVPSNLASVITVPYLVIAADRCSTFGYEEHDYKGRALRALLNATPEAVEREFSSGKLAQAEGFPNGYLANASATNVTPSTVPSISRGFQVLQDAVANAGFGGQAMFHCQPQAAPNFLQSRRVGPLLYDLFDNIIVPGVGYTGIGPSETAAEHATLEAAGETWIYATDLVNYRESDPVIFPDTFAEATDIGIRGTKSGEGGKPNTVTFYAERFAAAYWDEAVHLACKVKLAT